MYLILLILGVMVMLAGAGMLAFGIPINEFGLGNTLIIAGTAAFVGGLILIGVAEALRQLRRMAESLMARPVDQMPRANELFEPVPRGATPAAPRIPFPPKPEPRRRAPEPAMPPEPRLDIAPSLAAMEDQLDRSPLVSAGRAPEPRVVPERDEAPLSPQAEPRFAAERKEKDELAEGLVATAFSRLEVELLNAPPTGETVAPAAGGTVAPPAGESVKQDDGFESLWPPPQPRRDSKEGPRQQEPRQEDLTQAELRQEELRQEELQQEGLRQEELRQEELLQEELRQEELRQEELPREELRQEGLRQEGLRQEGLRQEGLRQEGLRQEEPRQEELRQEEPRQEEPRQEELRHEELRHEELRQEELRLEELPQEEPPAEPYAVSILKSGVVDGMAYTLYSDGSIEAEMPQGTMRFASITELRAYLDKASS